MTSDIDTPATLDELTALITERYSTLSKRLQQAAEYLLNHPSSSALGTVAAIAKEAGVQPSTLIRFSNALGFSGFSEMQNLFRQNLLSQSPSYTERIRKTSKSINGKSDAYALFRDFSSDNSLAIDELSTSLSKKDFSTAIRMLAKTQTIHIIGVRRAFSIASYLAYSLRHCDKKTFLVDNVGAMHKEQAANFNKSDLLVAISYHPYAQETRDVLNAAIEKGMKTIVITDNQLSPVKQFASVCFCVAEAEVFSIRSLCSSMCLAQSLTIGLANTLEKQKGT